jgi:hypothetical protein
VLPIWGLRDCEKNVRLGNEKSGEDEQKIILRARKHLDHAIGEDSDNRKQGSMI